MAVHLITGYRGKEHIQSKDARSFNVAMFGSGEFVMEIGQQLEASIINNNTVRVLDGDILMQGGHIRIETDTYEDLTIETGTAGKNRNDLIVMTYEKNSSDGTEAAYLEVLKGAEVAGSASDPEYTSGILAKGALKNQMPLYRVKIEGVVLSEIVPLFTTIPTYKTLAQEAAELYKEKLEALQGSDLLDTKEEIEANTQSNKFAGALAVKEFYDAIVNNLPKAINLFRNFETIDGLAWTKQIGQVVMGLSVDTCGFGFRKNCPVDGQLSLFLDGRFYQNEGQNMCLDTQNYSDYAIPKSGGTFSGNMCGIAGGIFATDGNVYIKSGNYKEWLSVILNDLYTNKAATNHKQAYTASELDTYTADENTMGVTPAAVKKAINGRFSLSGTTLYINTL